MSILSQHLVLVLNRGWVAIDVISLEKAICMALSTYKSGEPKIKILDHKSDFKQFTWDDWSELKPSSEEKIIRSAHSEYRVPDIVILTRRKNFTKHDQSLFKRHGVFQRDMNTCQYCGKHLPVTRLSIEHIVPRSQGGKSTWENCVVACIKCNSKKGGRTPEQAGMQLLKKPVKPKYIFPHKNYKCEAWELILGKNYWELS